MWIQKKWLLHSSGLGNRAAVIFLYFCCVQGVDFIYFWKVDFMRHYSPFDVVTCDILHRFYRLATLTLPLDIL